VHFDLALEVELFEFGELCYVVGVGFVELLIYKSDTDSTDIYYAVMSSK